MAFAVSMTSFGDVRQPISVGYMMLPGLERRMVD
jgi:hypothetical protein